METLACTLPLVMDSVSYCFVSNLNTNYSENSYSIITFLYSDELGDYLISKGADDSLQNANALTCYEGLDMDEL